MVRRSRPLALDADFRLSRRRAMQLGLGAAAAFGLTSMPMAPARVGAQDTGAADVIIEFALPPANRGPRVNINVTPEDVISS